MVKLSGGSGGSGEAFIAAGAKRLTWRGSLGATGRGTQAWKGEEGRSEMLTELRLDETDHRRRRIGFTGVGEGDDGNVKLGRLKAREREIGGRWELRGEERGLRSYL